MNIEFILITGGRIMKPSEITPYPENKPSETWERLRDKFTKEWYDKLIGANKSLTEETRG